MYFTSSGDISLISLALNSILNNDYLLTESEGSLKPRTMWQRLGLRFSHKDLMLKVNWLFIASLLALF